MNYLYKLLFTWILNNKKEIFKIRKLFIVILYYFIEYRFIHL